MINGGELFIFFFCDLLGKGEKIIGSAPPCLNV